MSKFLVESHTKLELNSLIQMFDYELDQMLQEGYMVKVVREATFEEYAESQVGAIPDHELDRYVHNLEGRFHYEVERVDL